jgi:hypothetical protein
MKESYHGTINGYIYHKCKCDECKIAWNEYQTGRRRQVTTGKRSVKHGYGGYASGCRCDVCRIAHAKYAAERIAVRKIAASGVYVELFEKQNGLCAICQQEKPLVPDHKHGTTEIRGLLCSSCNTGLGKLGDSIEGLQRALDYLNVK